MEIEHRRGLKSKAIIWISIMLSIFVILFPFVVFMICPIKQIKTQPAILYSEKVKENDSIIKNDNSEELTQKEDKSNETSIINEEASEPNNEDTTVKKEIEKCKRLDSFKSLIKTVCLVYLSSIIKNIILFYFAIYSVKFTSETKKKCLILCAFNLLSSLAYFILHFLCFIRNIFIIMEFPYDFMDKEENLKAEKYFILYLVFHCLFILWEIISVCLSFRSIFRFFATKIYNLIHGKIICKYSSENYVEAAVI